MKLAEALQVIGKSSATAATYPVTLACGFTPLHLSSYFAAHLQMRIPDRKVVIGTGLYDDLIGTVASLGKLGASSVALVMEWSDLDPRLGFRGLGGWGQKAVPSILESCLAKLHRFRDLLSKRPSGLRLVVSTPTLPLPPAFHTRGQQASEAELALRTAVAEFSRDISSHPFVTVLNNWTLDTISPPDRRYDLRSDLNSGFPYTLAHADQLGGMLAGGIEPTRPKKGLISDLDDTFWLGLVGEIGPEAVSWDLEHHSQIHGLYQQMLQALADHGVLVGIASKNSPEIVEKAFQRSDLAARRDSIYPLEVHWQPKSESVTRILKTWNIGADAVIFVDDSPLELEEVKARHPDVECILFPKSDPQAFLALLARLREAFGKPRLSEEDSYRLASIRNTQDLMAADSDGAVNDDLLATIQAEVTFEWNPPREDTRVLELINKTNQFNLNGKRIDHAAWEELRENRDVVVFAVQYRDKFGPLGKIAVLQGRRTNGSFTVESWVMSCRAFSRRIEHQTLRHLFEALGVSEIALQYAATAKNKPTQEFLNSILNRDPESLAVIRKHEFEAACPALHHKVTKN